MLDLTKKYLILILAATIQVIAIYCYQRGKNDGINKRDAYYQKIMQQQKIMHDKKLSELSESANNQRIKDAVKYSKLQTDWIITSSNLSQCRHNTEQLRIIYAAANVQPKQARTMGNGKTSGVIADSESEQFTCQDLGATYVACTNEYFKCSTKVNYLQGYIRGIFNGKKN